MKQRLVSLLNYVKTEDAKYLEQAKKSDEYFTGLLKPKKLDGNDENNTLYNSRKEFEMLCVMLNSNNVQQPEMMTVLRFFTTIKFYEKKKAKQPQPRRK